MNAVILAGGVRSGREVSGSGLPRALWPFPDKPLISLVLAFLRNSGCRRIAVCANGKTRMIASQLSSGATPWLDLRYSEDLLPRGPAGCLRDLHDWIGEETFVAIQGTAHYDFDLNAMLDEHRRTGAAITVGARRCSDDPELLEPVGVYLVEPRTLSLIQPVGFQDFKEQFLPKVLAAGMLVRCHTIRGSATLIHSPSHYLSAIGDAIQRAANPLPSGYMQRSPGVIVHESARIHPTARVSGPAWIDANVTIEEHAVVLGPTALAESSTVKGHALVHRAVLMESATAGVAAEVLSTVVAPNTVIRAAPAGNFEAFAPIDPPSRGFAAPLWDRMDRFFALFGTPRSSS
ncbi:MAG TPA: NDP-sugar synthase [Phycisphaerae bacterium]|nr:NDP-sugar synthase [Phycisphaerae bacterium]